MKEFDTIKEAVAVYTGGNIWLFYGETNEGNYFLTDDDGCTLILDADPEDFDVSLYTDWQEKHTIKELIGKERRAFCNRLVSYLEKADEDHRGGITDDELSAYRKYFMIEI